MLRMTDQVIIVIDEEQIKSKIMNVVLTSAIDYHDLRARQAVLSIKVSSRLNFTKLPMIKLTKFEFVESLLCGRSTHDDLQVLCFTDTNAAKLLATSMRDAAVVGSDLRKAHRCVERYLTIQFLIDIVDLEQTSIRHVLSHQTMSYQLFHEHQTTIVALMRGEEFMTFDVNETFSLAMFVHVSDADDIKPHHLQEQVTVILVDSVVNIDKTIIEFVQRVRKLHVTVHIVIVVDVVQIHCVSEESLNHTLARHAQLHLVALRLFDIKFIDSDITNTDNRLFNTTHLS